MRAPYEGPRKKLKPLHWEIHAQGLLRTPDIFVMQVNFDQVVAWIMLWGMYSVDSILEAQQSGVP